MNGKTDMEQISEKTKRLNKIYWGKFGFRILVLTGVVWISFARPRELMVLEGMNFFRHFSVLHLLWLLWAWYMLEKLLPLKQRKPKGCLKYRKDEFRGTKEYENWLAEGMPSDSAFRQKFQKERNWYSKGAWLVFGAWMLGAVAIFLLQRYGILGNRELLIGSLLFYIGDLVCILLWCPFRDILMKNQCCTKCRIYNWDTLMLILPILFIPGFFSYSLLIGALGVVGSWEVSHLRHPERFYSSSNACLQCGNCQGELGCIKLQKIRLRRS